jgi:hypothetical protein
MFYHYLCYFLRRSLLSTGNYYFGISYKRTRHTCADITSHFLVTTNRLVTSDLDYLRLRRENTSFEKNIMNGRNFSLKLKASHIEGLNLITATERHCREVSLPDAYRGGPGMRSRFGNRLFCLMFVVISLSLSR